MRPLLRNLSGKSQSDIIYLNGGLNTCSDQTEIRDNQLSHMWNVSLMESPTLSTRSNRLSLAWLMDDKSIYARGKALALFTSSSKTLYEIEEISGDNNNLYKYIPNNGYLEKIFVGSVEKADSYSICECRDASDIYIFISTPSKLYKYTEDDAMVEVNAYKGIIAGHKNRLWVASGNMLRFSNLSQYDNFTIDDQDPVNTAGEIQVTNAKGNIVAIVPYDGKLIILCDRSWHVLYGSSPNPEVDQFYLVDMDDGVGCCSRKGYAICDRALYWIDSDVSVYRYNGSSLVKISEPYGNDNYAQYGGIKNFRLNRLRLPYAVFGSFDNYLYICLTADITSGALNDTFLVYDTRNRVWWVEDGAFSDMIRWDTDVNTSFFNKTDYLIGAKYNGDLTILNMMQDDGNDIEFNLTTRDFDEVPIEYEFETKTWLLNSVKNKKTLTDIWWQANAEAEVFVFDNWTHHTPGQPDITFLPVGKLNKVGTHDILTPTQYFHEGTERQRQIIPRMYMQRVNAFTIRVKGQGKGDFHLLEKEWRIR